MASRRTYATSAAAVLAYIAAIVAANWMTAHYGLIPVLPGLLVTAGTYSAGLALLLRDVIQDTTGRAVVIAAIAAGGAISWGMSSPTLAVASVAAFLVSELADMTIYTPLRSRGWARAVLASNAAGGAIDTLVFLTLAGFPVTIATVSGQIIGKVLWATLIPVAVVAAVRAARTQVAA